MERFTMNVVDRLVPGVTTVTLNARYYALHGLISAEAQRRGLPRSAAQSLLRRAEVVVGAVSARHYRAAGFAHEALSLPHGYDEILMRASDGGADVAELAAPGVYAKPNWGFWPAYRGSEVLLRIVTRAGDIGPGDQMDTGAVAQGLGDVLDLVSRRTLDDATLDAYESLCICHSATSADGAWLARLFAASDAETPATRAGVRRQTLRMIARVIQLTEVRRVTRDVSRFLVYKPEAMSDPTGRHSVDGETSPAAGCRIATVTSHQGAAAIAGCGLGQPGEPADGRPQGADWELQDAVTARQRPRRSRRPDTAQPATTPVPACMAADRCRRSTGRGSRADFGGAGGEQMDALNGTEQRPTALNGIQLHPPRPASSRFRRSESVQRPVSHRRGHWFDPVSPTIEIHRRATIARGWLLLIPSSVVVGRQRIVSERFPDALIPPV
ncbi:hypothetical protein ACIBPB_33490 [Micromonospora sp. NPDC049836]|uniref:hypothetical protein n=1 Tax=Micromonospora sp. NPDC049836 TaxID=3364274 RepID=UPI003788911C